MFRDKKWRYLFFVILIFPMCVLVFYRMHVEKENIDELALVSFGVGNHDIQRVNIWEKEDNDYFVFLPTETEKIELELMSNQTFVLDEMKYKDGDNLNVQCGVVYDTKIIGKKDKLMEHGQLVFLKAESIPTVYIEADCASTDMIVREKDEKIDITISSFEREGELDFFGKCMLKGRGNSSWKSHKKPYNLTFEEDIALLGMQGQKKWALIANGDDPSLLKNKIANIFSMRCGLEYTPEMEYINLYVNGIYQGVYLLVQRIAAAGGCILWDEDEQNILFERDARYEREDDWFETDNCGIVYEASNFVTMQDLDLYKKRFEELEGILFDDENKLILEECRNIIDIDSWIKQYMIEEFIANADMDYASRYYYKKADEPVLHSGPLWDCDNSIGKLTIVKNEIPANIMRYEDVGKGYFNGLMRHEDFQTELVQYYEDEFQYIIDEVVYSELPECIITLEKSMNLDDIRWDKNNKFEGESEKVVNWLENRTVFWKNYWNKQDDYFRIRFRAGCGVYYIKKGTSISFLPQRVDHEYTKWLDENGKEISMGMLVTEDMELYPEYLD